MKLIPEHRKQVKEIVHDLIRQSEDEKFVVTRMWVTVDMVCASYYLVNEEIVRQFAKTFGRAGKRQTMKIGFAQEEVMEEKKRRFGSGTLAFK